MLFQRMREFFVKATVSSIGNVYISYSHNDKTVQTANPVTVYHTLFHETKPFYYVCHPNFDLQMTMI